VELAAGRKKSGDAPSRESAIFDAVRVIDTVLGMELKTTPKILVLNRGRF
jgi:hypothetical protein